MNSENRHGLITDAAGVDKTVTLNKLVKTFSDMGVPVLLPDIKGDLAGLDLASLELTGLDPVSPALPVVFWDAFGKDGLPVRTSVSGIGAPLLSRILELNDTQTSILSSVFQIADNKGLLLLDLKDLRAMLQYVGENGREFTLTYGNISKRSIGAIIRNILILEDQQGGDLIFGEPALDFYDLLRTDPNGHGYINILHSVKLYRNPVLYSTFLLWMLSELFEMLPETDDYSKPKIVFFFDESQLLFKGVPKPLLDRMEQVFRMSRSKGIEIHFITQHPDDLPQNVLNMLENRVQPISVEALVTGPAVAISAAERKEIINGSPLKDKYERPLDRESAYEILKKDTMKMDAQNVADRSATERDGAERGATKSVKTDRSSGERSSGRGYTRQTPMEKAVNAVFSTIGREVGRSLIRGILGSLKK